MSLGVQVLKNLVLEYQENKNDVTFSKILKRVDRLLLSIIHKHVRRRRLEKVDLRDLYHSSIVGLGRAIKTSPKIEAPDKVVARIIAYVRLEIDNDFWKKHRPTSDKRVPLCNVGIYQTDCKIIENAEYVMLLELFRRMILESVLSLEEVCCFLDRNMNSKGYKEIGKELGITRDGARKKLIEIKKKINIYMFRTERDENGKR